MITGSVFLGRVARNLDSQETPKYPYSPYFCLSQVMLCAVHAVTVTLSVIRIL